MSPGVVSMLLREVESSLEGLLLVMQGLDAEAMTDMLVATDECCRDRHVW